MPYLRQARPASGLGFKVKVPETIEVVPSSLAGLANPATSRDLLGAGRCRRAVLTSALRRFRAKRGHLTTFHVLLSESQGQNLALTVFYVPKSLDSGQGGRPARWKAEGTFAFEDHGPVRDGDAEEERERHQEDAHPANSPHMRQSRPDSGLGFQVKF